MVVAVAVPAAVVVVRTAVLVVRTAVIVVRAKDEPVCLGLTRRQEYFVSFCNRRRRRQHTRRGGLDQRLDPRSL